MAAGIGHKTCFYILASKLNGTLYTGVTNDVERRLTEHKNGEVDGFTKKYRIHLLVYYEVFDRIENAIEREKNLKNWKRAWKIELIEKENPLWRDLSDDFLVDSGSRPE
ncbi:MAG: GIY-YIG nuclease family protein [Candidatus Vogelbacteria bacterium]|nr:GIY-YIG nuclease family protein [Candidatus Vogelbacteria bacterium]